MKSYKWKLTKTTYITKTAEIMANLGQSAEFVNIGGNGTAGAIGKTGNVLLDTLAGIPELMKVLNVENQALNGKSINDEVHDLIDSAVGPAKGLLVSNEKVKEIETETKTKTEE